MNEVTNGMLVVVGQASIPHLLNWQFGWWLALSGVATGIILGLGFHNPEFMGGYDSFRRRLVRLGHIAQFALGMINVLYGLSPLPEGGTTAALLAGWCFVGGGVAMPLVCFLSAWKETFRHAFAVPVVLLAVAVATTALAGGR